MIKEIAEEYKSKKRENILNLLKHIKDLKYTVIGIYNNILYYKDEKEYLEIYIYFNSKEIIKIDISQTANIGGYNIILIEQDLNTKGVTAISEELYKKYLKNKKGAK